ncbi:hypothetical protein Q0V21_03530 [Paenibacillus sp. 11B]|uniref:hypothetical protein n=1 Tax=Paenibacillus TaxID=44249 RepID=UPI000BA01D42|nr:MULTISPECIES: hypothetical protein [Paenibacillus]MDN8587833.1 hypothetical protein [Paenibacillus sp. 11B]OZQ72408.1 hypothetical protein CA599_06340 [Paenibacillus taichungensis]HBU85824.1 hypothetical protein [Paenibacillus sp.]
MSVRINQSHTSSARSHKELSDIGVRTHTEIDSCLAELDDARGSEVSLGDRITLVEESANVSRDKVNDHEQRLGDVETTVTSNISRLDDVQKDILTVRADVNVLSKNQDDHEKRLSLAEIEIKEARGAESSIDHRFDTLEKAVEVVSKQPIQDLGITNPTYLSMYNSVQVTINAGRASINKVIVDQFSQTFSIPDITANTSYYIFLHEDGRYSYSLKKEEPQDAIIIGGLDVGVSPTTSLTAMDFRYFLTKGSIENDMSALGERVSDLETTVGKHTTKIVTHDATIKAMQTELETTSNEVVVSREDKNGVVYDALKDRLDNMQSRLELAESRGTMEHQSVFHFTSSPNSRLSITRDFQVPRYVIGSNSAEVFLDGIRMDVGDDYIEYSDTLIRFRFDVPKEARVTVIGRGSVINTTSVTDYTYYTDGKVHIEKVNGGINRTIEYFYSMDGNLERQEITESNGQIKSIEYQRDLTGKVLREINNGAEYYVLQGGDTFDDTDIRRRIDFLEGSAQELDIVYNYYSNGDIESEEVYSVNATPHLLKRTSFTYNTDGTVKTETLIYDGRGVHKAFEYDAIGNIKQVKIRKVVI